MCSMSTACRRRRSWCTGSLRAPGAESCSCAPNIKRASSPGNSPNRGFPRSTYTATCPSPRGSCYSHVRRRQHQVLVATDIAARGVHVDEVELVVHIDPPSEHKSYLHRSGRTARAGSAGDVVTVVLPEQREHTRALMRKAGIDVAPQRVTAGSEAVHALVGPIAPRSRPRPPVCRRTRPGRIGRLPRDNGAGAAAGRRGRPRRTPPSRTGPPHRPGDPTVAAPAAPRAARDRLRLNASQPSARIDRPGPAATPGRPPLRRRSAPDRRTRR